MLSPIDAVPELAADRALDAKQVVLAGGDIGVSLVVIRRAARDELRQAAGGVAAEQRALRACAQVTLPYPIDVEQGEGQAASHI